MTTDVEASKVAADAGTVPAARDAWVKPEIISFEAVSNTESVTGFQPGDIINSNS